MDKVKCNECGFLSLRHRENRGLYEVDAFVREQGTLPTVRALADSPYETDPVCFMMACQLNLKSADAKGFLDVVAQERTCDSFMSWHQGYTPKEHQEMLKRQEWRDWQAEERQRDRDWQTEQRSQEREWQQAQESQNRMWREKQESKLMWAAGIFTLLGAVIAAAVTAAVTLLGT